MAIVIVQHLVKDFDSWFPVYDGDSDNRRAHGELGSSLYRSVGDGNDVSAVFEWDTVANAKAFFANTELKQRMMAAGVVGPPRITIAERA